MKELIKKFIPPFLISWYHFSLAFLGALIYRFPSRKIKVIGVTGTNGKSTVAEMATQILEEADYKVALISSIKFKIGEKEWPNDLKMTMPGRFQIQRFLCQAVNAGCQYAILEVTSEGIKQHRHRFINFKTAVFTNLTPEHIEAHGSFEKYRQAKEKLFQATKKIHIINLDDENAEYFLKFPAEEKYLYKIKNTNQKSKIIEAENCKASSEGLKFSVKNTEFNLKLLGEFNIYNSLAAICLGLSQEISLETCKSALEKIKGIPGRMEMVISQPFKVFVDYAFTPVALEKVYQTLTYKLKNLKTEKLICVLGACGGGRDKWKRPVLGELAAKYCDEIIVTDEDPYDEDPYQILSMIKSGITNYQPSTRAKPRIRAELGSGLSRSELRSGTGLGAGPVPHRNKVSGAGLPTSKFYEILDRRKAIKKSLELAKSGDMVVITGKGCEPWICVAGGKKIPWDDRKVVKEEFKKLNP